MTDDGADAIGKNFASYVEAEGLPSNSQIADWLRSAFTAAQGEPISISPLAALVIAEMLGGGSADAASSPIAGERRARGRPKKISAEQGEKTALADWDFYFQFHVIRER